MRLINEAISRALGEVAYAGGHGASGAHIGLSLLYYAIPYGLRSRLSVCLGSGGGMTPFLMRQAQKDLGLVGARTILVDAVMPEVGFGAPDLEGGWLHADSLLRRTHPDIAIWLMRTDAAARVFAKWGRPIDYLHIDADHSTEGVLADVRDYLPLISPQATITFHDTRMPSVEAAIDQVRRDLPDHALLNFPDAGQGIAILRPRLDRGARVVAGRYNVETPLGTEDRDAEHFNEDPSMWRYLTEKPLYARHAVAAPWIGRFDTVIEVGGYVTPIGPHLREAPGEYLVIDPLCEPFEADTLNGAPCRVRHLKDDLDSFDLGTLAGKSVCTVFLGMQIDESNKSPSEIVDTIDRFLSLLSASKLAVLEFPPSWASCVRLFDLIIAQLEPKILFEVTLDLSQNAPGMAEQPSPDRLVRRMIILDGFKAYVSGAQVRKAIALAMFGPSGPALLAVEAYEQIPNAAPLSGFATHHGTTSLVGDALHLEGAVVPWGYLVSSELPASVRARQALMVTVRMEIVSGEVYAAICNDAMTEAYDQKLLKAPGVVQAQLRVDAPSTQTRIVIRFGPNTDVPVKARLLGVDVAASPE